MCDRSPTFASPDDLAPPSGYSHVVSIPAGRLVWTSGQVALDSEGNVARDDGWEGQTRLAFANVGKALRAAGAGWPDVVKLTFYVVDVFRPCRPSARSATSSSTPPARRRAHSCRSRASFARTC